MDLNRSTASLSGRAIAELCHAKGMPKAEMLKTLRLKLQLTNPFIIPGGAIKTAIQLKPYFSV